MKVYIDACVTNKVNRTLCQLGYKVVLAQQKQRDTSILLNMLKSTIPTLLITSDIKFTELAQLLNVNVIRIKNTENNIDRVIRHVTDFAMKHA
jgi:predicted nuclease of predicted toxin-antitoxin system